MQLLKEKILKYGRVLPNRILKVDSFLNHQIDVSLLNEMGKEFKNIFGSENVTKILTVEASGIGIACIAAQYFNVPVLFAKKHAAGNLDKETYESEVYSYTRGKNYTIRVSKNYLSSEDRVLIIDDFLAKGKALLGLGDIVAKAGAHLVGAGIVIEKGFQEGGKLVRESGINLHSLAIIKSMDKGYVEFEE